MSGLIILLLVGIIFMVANAVKTTTQHQLQLNTEDATGVPSNVKVVYKYLPLDLDTFYRVGDMHTPSKLYASMFLQNESELTERA